MNKSNQTPFKEPGDKEWYELRFKRDFVPEGAPIVLRSMKIYEDCVIEANTLLNHSDPFNFLGIYLTVIVIFLDITGLSWGICI